MKDLKPIYPWEALVSLLGLSLAAVVAVQRHTLYSKGKWGLFTEDSLPLVIWALVALVVTLAGKPWNLQSRYGSQVRFASVKLTFYSLIFVLMIVTGWGRYQITRFETLYLNLGVSSLSEGLRTRAWPELSNPDSGRHICEDRELLLQLTRGDREFYLEHPRYARIILASLLHHGVKVDEIESNDFLLAGLLAEADPQPWHRLDYVPLPDTFHESSIGLITGLLSDQEAKEIVQTAMAELEKTDQYNCQALVFSLMNWPSLFEDGQPEALLKKWTSLFTEVEPLAVEGLVMRDIVKSALGPEPTVKVRFELSGLSKDGPSHKIEWFSVPQSILGLLRSCGKDVVEVEAGEDVIIKAKLFEVSHHTYSAPTYDYETYYENETTYSGSKYMRSRTRKVRKTRQVATGSETRTSYAPFLEVSLVKPEGEVELDRTLLYWHHLHYDHEKKIFLNDKNGSVYGRMWPFGIRERLYNFGFLRPDYSYY